jgi:hypothetical protein
MIVSDSISIELEQFIKKLIQSNTNTNICIEHHNLHPKTGIADSIRYCYQWLTDNGQHLVFQVQDDYLFCESAINDSIGHFYAVKHEADTHPIIQPFNDVTYWAFQYKNRSTPRLISLGKNGYWVQIYDTSCSFLTSHWQFVQHWDLYEKFFELLPKVTPEKFSLENESLNHIFVYRGVLGLAPINTLSHHMQTQPDLYVKWQPLWDNIDVDI